MKKALPIYKIDHFHGLAHEHSLYVNKLIPHIKEHHFIATPHKHDFYLVILFTHGSGTHEIDFKTYPVKPGTLFMMQPGQTHNWKLSADIDGFVFFHDAAFYDEGFTHEKIKNYPFFNSIHNPPFLLLKNKAFGSVRILFEALFDEYRTNEPLKLNKLHCLANLIYIELARNYKPPHLVESEKYMGTLTKLEDLIDKNFREIKYPHEYAEKMNLSEKHLNRICKSALNLTTSDLIANRVILEAKRLMTHSQLDISQIADELGYADPSYFTRFFKKRTGKTPLEFRSTQSLGK